MAEATAKATERADPVVIKKYANRRLYNTQSSSYITLDDLAKMTRNGVDFQVLDAKTGDSHWQTPVTRLVQQPVHPHPGQQCDDRRIRARRS